MLLVKKIHGVFFAVAILFAMPCFAVLLPIFAQDSDSETSKLTSLFEERRETLKTRLEMVEQLVGVARSTPEALLAARDDLYNAEVEMATNSKDRISALQRKLENAKQRESIMEQRKRKAVGTEVEVLMAKSDRLGIEIQLLRETEQQDKPE